jgi:hypothetical protein
MDNDIRPIKSKDDAAPVQFTPTPQLPTSEPQSQSNKNSRNKWLIVTALLIVVILVGAYILMLNNVSKNAFTATPPPTPAVATTPPASKVQGLQLDAKKNYGNKYSSGILPVGDNKYTSDAAKQGNVYVCSQYAQNLKSDKGGAGSRGPWFVNNNTQYDLNKKLKVQGGVSWNPSFSVAESGSTRTITTNDLPNHPTGTFPISAKDPAYAYDRNPNSIKAQSLTYNLSDSPTYGTPNCVGGEVGVMLTGVALFNGFDAGGRDAGAWEIQDGCSGHPQVSGEYHYHTLSSCIKDTSVSTIIGYALDGFPITGPQVGANNILTTSDLDECHGITSEITLNGKKAVTYHYVMTQDFPYSISCFRAQAAQPPGREARQSPPQQPPR